MPRKHPPPHRTHKAPRNVRTMRKPRVQHDSAYKLFFSQAAMVRSLLLLIASELVAELDLDTLERLPGEHVARGGQKRFSDIVWKVQRKGRSDAPCYIAILLEFQSTPDRLMALRLLTYVALLLEELAKDKEVQESGLLPPVLPIVLYSGGQPWTGAQDVAELFAPMPENLRPLNPQMRYLLLEERKVPEETLKDGGLAAQLIRLEQAGDPQALQEAVGAFLASLHDDGREVLTAAIRLLVGDTCRRLGIPVEGKEQAMLEENLRRWRDEAVAEARAEGRAEGEAKGRVATVLNMLKKGLLPPEDIAEYSGMTVAEVRALAAAQ